MQENDKPVLIYSTFPSARAAESAGEELVRQGLCACVNVLPQMTSIYRWQGEIEKATEAVMIVKTRAALTGAVFAAVTALHPYDVPALIVLPADAAAPYFEWIVANTRAAAGLPPSLE